MTAWSPEIYELWREEWQREHPGRTPPDADGFARLMEMFGFSPEEVFGVVFGPEAQ